jgi:hypothetical protein
MTNTRYAIVDGPDKPALQKSLAGLGEHDVQFRVEGDAINAQIMRMDEEPDGFSFKLRGKLSSGRDQGSPFYGFYSVGTRSGWLELRTGKE